MKQSALKRPQYSSHISRIVITCAVALIALTITTNAFVFSSSRAQTIAPQPSAQEAKQTDVRELKLGQPIDRELAGGEAHSYRVLLTAGQYLHVVVEQKGIDVMIRLVAPDGQKMAEVDNDPAVGMESVSTVAEAIGDYHLEVRSQNKDVAIGRYEIEIEELREATSKDRVYVAAQKAFEEANQLRDQQKAESRRKAITKYEEVLLLWRDVGNKKMEAYTLIGLGIVAGGLGESKTALEYYGRAVLLWRDVGDRLNEATTLSNIGLDYWRLGELQKALEYYSKALPLRRAVGDREGEAYTLNNIGISYTSLGRLQKALEYLSQALPLMRALGDRLGEASTLHNIAAVYQQLGDWTKALEFYNQSLPLRRAAGNRQGETVTLYNIGSVYESSDELSKALEYFQLALPLSRSTGDRRIEAYILSNTGSTYRKLGEPGKALDYLNQALSLRRAVVDKYGEAYTLINLGDSYGAHKEPLKALEYYRQALQLSRITGDRAAQTKTLYALARTHGELGNLVEARTDIEAALNIIESTRTEMVSQQLRSPYLATKKGSYEFYVDLLMRLHQIQPSAGHDAAAIQISERGRARSLLEILNEARADIRQGVDPVLLEQERSLQQQLSVKAERLTRLLGGKHTEEQETAARKDVDAILADYHDVEAQIRAKSPRYASLTQPQPLSLKEIQQMLDQDTLLLEYALGEDRSYLWAVTPTSIKSFELPKRAAIETVAQRFYKLVTENENRAIPAQAEAATALSQLLLAPVASDLGQKRLVIVSDGALQYVPFAALPIPMVIGEPRAANSRTRSNRQPSTHKYQPLIVQHEIVQLPSASVLGVLRQQTAGRTQAANMVAVLADPVFQSVDPRVKHDKASASESQGAASDISNEAHVESDLKRSARESGLQDLQRLPFSRREAEAIVALAPAGQSLKALDFDASRATVTGDKFARYRIIHFATHGLLNTVHPELSGIVLSLVDEAGRPQDGFLRLHEIYNLNLPAELVVLSGCQTALGKQVKGEGLIGLTRGFMYAGAARIVVSLWEVNDEATADLMRRFYEGMLKKGMRPAAALRTAQLAMWKSKWWNAPYYWAGFVMQGEWQ